MLELGWLKRDVLETDEIAIVRLSLYGKRATCLAMLEIVLYGVVVSYAK